ncbi:MAG: DNA polymerase/3'-5' exonuclease PolX [Acidobacteriota bacterium]
MKNRELSEIFDKMADILEFKGDNPFKINAYRKAARVLKDLTEDIEKLAQEGKLKDLSGVGSGIAKKIEEYLETGRVSKYEEVKEGLTDGLIELLKIPDLGPKTLALLHKEMGIKNMAELEEALQSEQARTLPGMGAKKAENILRGIRLLKESGGRIPLGVAIPLVDEVIELMKTKGIVREIFPAGSLRRFRETIGDIDLLATGKDGTRIIEEFTHLPLVTEVLAAGKTKGSVITHASTQVDLRVVPGESFGAALQYFTGSKAHNVRLREIAKSQGLKINEYGVFRGEERIGGSTEEEVYRILGLPWIPPELREDRGEIDAAMKGSLPSLVELADIKGDLHVHSNWSDGNATLEELAEQAKRFGYEYLLIADHSFAVRIAGGLSPEELLRQIKEIKKINQKLKGITLLAGTEVDIRSGGSLDFPDELLEKLDVVVAAVHSGFKQDVHTMTKRILGALENPLVDIIAHPTGRLIGGREPYAVDLNEILYRSAATGTALEINAYYERLDLSDLNCREAKKRGAKLVISTDAHQPHQLGWMRLGVAVARRGWLEKGDVLNTLPLKQFLNSLKR